MPYFLYKIFPNRKLEKIESHDSFREAKARARSLRGELAPDAGYSVKIIFAKTPEEAQRTLSEVREAPPKGVNEEF